MNIKLIAKDWEYNIKKRVTVQDINEFLKTVFSGTTCLIYLSNEG